jgi:small neutral amino acid transporter SnatA (MarC family)
MFSPCVVNQFPCHRVLVLLCVANAVDTGNIFSAIHGRMTEPCRRNIIWAGCAGSFQYFLAFILHGDVLSNSVCNLASSSLPFDHLIDRH